MTLTVACVYTRDQSRADYHGKDCTFSREYPDKLKAMVERHLTIPHRFVCLAETVKRDYDVQLDHVWPSYWCKISLFEHLTGPTLYLDLDTLIVGNIDFMGTPGEAFEMWWYGPEMKASGTPHWVSAFMAWNGDYSFITRRFRANPRKVMGMYKSHPKKGDQAYIADMIENEDGFTDLVNIAPVGTVVQFPCRDVGNASLVYCSGSKKPHLYRDNAIIMEHWR